MKAAERIREKWQNKRYEQQLFLQFLIWVSVPLLIMTGISCFIFVHGESQKSRIMLENYAEQLESACGNYFTTLREYYLDVVNSSSWQSFLAEKEAPKEKLEELVQLKKTLDGGRIESSVSAYCLVNVRYGWVLCNNGMYNMEELQNLGELQALIRTAQVSAAEVQWVDNGESLDGENSRMGYRNVDLSGKLLLLKNLNFDGELLGMLVVAMDFSNIKDSLNGYEELGYEAAVAAGEEILAGGDSAFILAGEERNSRYRTAAVADRSNSLQYIVAYDTRMSSRKALILLEAAFAFLAAYLCLLVLLKKVTNMVSEPFWKLKASNEEQQEKLKEFFAVNVLKGTWEEERIRQYMEKYGWKSYSGYRLMLLRLREEKEGLEELLHSAAASEEVPMCFQPVQYRGCIAVLTGAGDEMQVEYNMALLYQNFSACAEKMLHCSIIAGVSGHFEKLEDCDRAVNQCLDAIRTRRDDRPGESVLAVYDNFALQKRNTEILPDHGEMALYEAVSKGERERAEQLLHETLQRMDEQHLWGIERAVQVQQLLLGLVTIVEKQGIPLCEVFHGNERNPFTVGEQLYENEKLERYIKEKLLAPLTEALQNNQLSKDAETVRKAVRLIRESGGYITLTECAEQIGCHPGYLSRVIKKERGVGFQDLINEEKIERASQMLRHTSISVAEIAEQLGYNNTQNFIRFFKNQTGTTPAKYRKEEEQ